MVPASQAIVYGSYRTARLSNLSVAARVLKVRVRYFVVRGRERAP
jgi:hypothetical protein